MSRNAFPDSDRLPAEIRDLALRLREDLARLRLKWSYHRELFGSRENTRLLTDTARACFQVVEESLRYDIILSLCRLSDPSRTLGGESPSFATLVAQCGDIPRAEDLLTAFQAACGPVRRYRHRHLGHNDPEAIIEPQQRVLPDVDPSQLDEILGLAGGLLRAIFAYYSAGDPLFQPVHAGSAADLIHCLRGAHQPPRKEMTP
jgi:hypothetical protein